MQQNYRDLGWHKDASELSTKTVFDQIRSKLHSQVKGFLKRISSGSDKLFFKVATVVHIFKVQILPWSQWGTSPQTGWCAWSWWWQWQHWRPWARRHHGTACSRPCTCRDGGHTSPAGWPARNRRWWSRPQSAAHGRPSPLKYKTKFTSQNYFICEHSQISTDSWQTVKISYFIDKNEVLVALHG